MQIDLMDVRLDVQRRPYMVHETVTELKETEACLFTMLIERGRHRQ
ncbi:MAG: hypothetical protein PHE02_07095 [Lachnospiraceae bacterium]|nr:hypothetical protein [Lachnospiraceae bacterium]